MNHEFYSDVRNGTLQTSTRNKVAELLKYFEGKRIRIVISKAKSKRSEQQNRYLHLLFTIFTDALNDLGNEFKMPEVKELCKTKFALIDVVNEETGEVIGQRIKGTSEMNKTELNEFFENIIRWASEHFGIILPYPNEQLKTDFEDETA